MSARMVVNNAGKDAGRHPEELSEKRDFQEVTPPMLEPKSVWSAASYTREE